MFQKLSTKSCDSESAIWSFSYFWIASKLRKIIKEWWANSKPRLTTNNNNKTLNKMVMVINLEGALPRPEANVCLNDKLPSLLFHCEVLRKLCKMWLKFNTCLSFWESWRKIYKQPIFWLFVRTVFINKLGAGEISQNLKTYVSILLVH